MQKTKEYSSEMASSFCLKERAKAPQIRILHLTVTGWFLFDHIFFKNIDNGTEVRAVKYMYLILID